MFKKAYELGVLCSVDIAVIVFGGRVKHLDLCSADRYDAEERPGHHTKLYQYGSRDVSEIVQRHLNVRNSLSVPRRLPTDCINA